MPRLSEEKKALLDQMMQEKICNAAADVIIENGFEQLTMDKVAERANVAKGTLYNYFKDKSELLVSVANSILDPLDKSIADIANSDMKPLKKLEGIAHAMLETFSKKSKLFFIIDEARFSGMLKSKRPFGKRKMVLGFVSKIIDDAKAEGSLNECHTQGVAEIFLGMVMSINISKITSGVIRPVDEDLNTIMTIFSQGLVNRGK